MDLPIASFVRSLLIKTGSVILQLTPMLTDRPVPFEKILVANVKKSPFRRF
jgi:hypothetical protein